MTNQELNAIINAIKDVAENHNNWEKDYIYNPRTNEFKHKTFNEELPKILSDWFTL